MEETSDTDTQIFETIIIINHLNIEYVHYHLAYRQPVTSEKGGGGMV